MINRSHIVTKSNELIEARYKQSLSTREQKIILTIVSMIQPEDEDFSVYELYIRDFYEMLGLSGREHYAQLKEIVGNLMTKVVEIPRPDGGWLLTHWASHAEYIAGEGKIELSFDPKLKPYLLQLKRAFKSYRLSNVLSLKSAYSIRLYELMKKWEKLGKWECSIESLREKIGIEKDKYKLYGHLKSRVIDVAVKELNEKTDVFVTYKEIRKGRKVIKLEFTIKDQPEKEIKLPSLPSSGPQDFSDPTPVEALRLLLNDQTKGYSFDTATCQDLLDKGTAIWSDNVEESLLTIANHVNGSKGIDNKIGYFRSIINKAFKQHKAGETVLIPSFEIRTEQFPDHFKDQSQKKSSRVTLDELKEERFMTYKNLGMSEEEIKTREEKLYALNE
jgi:hypothetical protein